MPGCPHRDDTLCPVCRGTTAVALLGLLTTGLGCGVGQTLYGGPMVMDADFDGTPDEQDCAPDNPDVHPGAEDAEGDDVDSNCDGVDGVRTE